MRIDVVPSRLHDARTQAVFVRAATDRRHPIDVTPDKFLGFIRPLQCDLESECSLAPVPSPPCVHAAVQIKDKICRRLSSAFTDEL